MMDGHIWINGAWEKTTNFTELIAPYTGKVIGNVAKATKEDVQRAIEGAEIAFSSFKKWTAYDRAELLYKVVEILRERKEELARILSEEAGKPLKAARAEYDRTIATYQFSAEAAKQIQGETIPMDAAPGAGGRIGWTRREAIGVVSAISPFNFPANLIAHKLGPAFAVGNTVVLKPSSATPRSALVLAEIFKQAGLPDGALQIVTGSGSELSEVLTTHPAVKKVTFTGSVPVGLSIKEKIGLRKITLELGSNSALIVEPGVPLNKIIKRCVDGAFGFAGQVCISLQRIYVQESIYTEFVQLFTEETRNLIVGDPLNETTDISAMINPKEVSRIREWIEEAIEQGANVATGGDFTERTMSPTVLTNVTKEMSVVCKEVFAPIVSVLPYKNLNEAIDLVNDSDFGLNAGIFTPNIMDAMHATNEIQAGAVIINDIPTFRIDNMPYGGVKMSGYGREGVKYAVEEMTELKLISMKTSFD
ncbi:aldehyde dehydrogenase family protein [Psychrobacillus vulpis]|uniref:Aldehyde dehydrogenase family protein n=1 Tax=Psychrobacillus vulpis TaxID=2325572 RepID=A0A544TNH2_9BACI|nr:aldehyde dehydrogenase family protein [Psychrobacillus vulpis]TQR18990.1 aldehyde dehydrogenase family protein [Psychrobacillus vulpis]